MTRRMWIDRNGLLSTLGCSEWHYRPALRRRAAELRAAANRTGGVRWYVLEGDVVKAAASHEQEVRQYMAEGRILACATA